MPRCKPAAATTGTHKRDTHDRLTCAATGRGAHPPATRSRVAAGRPQGTHAHTRAHMQPAEHANTAGGLHPSSRQNTAQPLPQGTARKKHVANRVQHQQAQCRTRHQPASRPPARRGAAGAHPQWPTPTHTPNTRAALCLSNAEEAAPPPPGLQSRRSPRTGARLPPSLAAASA